MQLVGENYEVSKLYQTEALGGDVGLAISYVIMLAVMFQYGVRQSAELENQMVSVERVMEYSRLKEEAALDSPPGKTLTQCSASLPLPPYR